MKRKSNKKIVVDEVVLCAKKAGKNSASIWVLANPDIRAEAKTLAQAEELLVDKIWSVCDLDEPFALKYDDADLPPSMPEDTLLRVGPNVVTDTPNPAQYFNEGFCSNCESGKGGRNGEMLKLERVPKKVTAGLIVRFETGPWRVQFGAKVVHASIADKIMAECDPLIEFRPVMDVKRAITDYREVIPTRRFPEVSPRGKKDPGAKCPDCGSVCLYNDLGTFYLKIDDANIIRQHGAAAIGCYQAPDFCVSNRIWQSIKKLEAARRLLKHGVITELDDKNIQPNPKLKRIVRKHG